MKSIIKINFCKDGKHFIKQYTILIFKKMVRFLVWGISIYILYINGFVYKIKILLSKLCIKNLIRDYYD